MRSLSSSSQSPSQSSSQSLSSSSLSAIRRVSVGLCSANFVGLLTCITAITSYCVIARSICAVMSRSLALSHVRTSTHTRAGGFAILSLIKVPAWNNRARARLCRQNDSDRNYGVSALDVAHIAGDAFLSFLIKIRCTR